MSGGSFAREGEGGQGILHAAISPFCLCHYIIPSLILFLFFIMVWIGGELMPSALPVPIAYYHHRNDSLGKKRLVTTACLWHQIF